MPYYGTIPQEFRHALETAFPNLVSNSAAIKAFEPDEPFQPDEPVEILLPGEMIPHTLVGVTVYQRASDGYFNATAMCQAAGKEWFGYTRNAATKEFMTELEGSPQICGDPVVVTITTGPNAGRGTWVHPDVAIHLAQWCSAKFAVQVSRWVREWFTTGSTPQAIKLPQTYVEALRALADSAEEAQQLKLENLEANQVIGETRAQLVNTEIKLETAEDQVEVLLHKIELPKVSILTEEFCKLYLEVEGRQGLALVKTATAEKVHAVALRDEAPMDDISNEAAVVIHPCHSLRANQQTSPEVGSSIFVNDTLLLRLVARDMPHLNGL